MQQTRHGTRYTLGLTRALQLYTYVNVLRPRHRTRPVVMADAPNLYQNVEYQLSLCRYLLLNG